MVSDSLRQKPTSATEQNATSRTSIAASRRAPRPAAATASAAVRPVSGTPSWARRDHARGAPRPASPWDDWTIPPKPPGARLATSAFTSRPSPSALASRPGAPAVASRPAPSTLASLPGPSSGRAAPSPGFRPWRIDFTRPDVVEYPDEPPPEPATIAKRLLLLLGLAYLFVAALASGLAYTSYFATAAATPDGADSGRRPDTDTGRGHGADPDRRPDTDTGRGRDADTGAARHDRPDEPRPPSRHPHAPGLHTRPDGSRYLVMPLPADLADRFRDRSTATAVGALAKNRLGALGAATVIGGGAA